MLAWLVMNRQQPPQARNSPPKHPRFFPAPIPILGLPPRRSQKNPTLSFHALTWNPFCIPFVSKFMHGMGVVPPPIKKATPHEHSNRYLHPHPRPHRSPAENPPFPLPLSLSQRQAL